MYSHSKKQRDLLKAKEFSITNNLVFQTTEVPAETHFPSIECQQPPQFVCSSLKQPRMSLDQKPIEVPESERILPLKKDSDPKLL